jgi:ketosteroid isomerase-like protein
MSFADDCAHINNVWNSYALGLDRPDFDAMAELFAEDARWADGEIELHGKAAIRAGLEEAIRTRATREEIDFPIKHVMSNPVIDIDGDKAIGRWYLTVMKMFGPVGEPPVAMLGDYKIKFVRSADGWLIQQVDFFFRWTADHARVSDGRF